MRGDQGRSARGDQGRWIPADDEECGKLRGFQRSGQVVKASVDRRDAQSALVLPGLGQPRHRLLRLAALGTPAGSHEQRHNLDIGLQQQQ